MTYTILRQPSTANGTLGTWYDENGDEMCKTCERPSMGPHPCIPAGTYTCQKYSSENHPNVWEVTNVPGRTAILIHNGNTENDSLGCILVGDEWGEINGLPAVLHSNVTLDALRGWLPDTFELQILDTPNA